MSGVPRSGRTQALLVALLAAGCSFIVNTSDRVQCSTDADCDANPALSGRVCDLGFCALRPSPVSDDGGPGCASTEVCTQANSGRASVCRRADRPCVEWQIEGCPSITGSWKDPNAIVIGSLLPLSIRLPRKPLPSKYSKRVLRAIDLAVDEIEAGAPAGFFIAGESRPIAVLHCDSAGDPAVARAMFTHFTDVVGAPAVIVGWDEDMAAVTALAAERKTTVVCSDCLAPLPADPRVWRILPPLSGDAALVAARVLELETQIKAQTPGDIRVAVLVDGARAQKSFLDELAKILVFNGAGVASNGATRYLPVATPDPTTSFIDYDAYAREIADFEPHIVIAAMASDFPTYHLLRIEKELASTAPRPHYLLTQISYDAEHFQNVLADDELRARVSGTYPFMTEVRANNLGRYESTYRATYKEAANGNSSGYEAFYSLALAIASRVGQRVLDGPQISAGFPSLVSGTPFDIGPGPELNIAMSAVRNQPIDLRGLYTDLDWDLQTGVVVSDMGVFCFGKEPDGSIVLRNAGSMRWSVTTKKTTGSFSCPP